FATNFLNAALVACTDLLALLPMLALPALMLFALADQSGNTDSSSGYPAGRVAEYRQRPMVARRHDLCNVGKTRCCLTRAIGGGGMDWTSVCWCLGRAF